MGAAITYCIGFYISLYPRIFRLNQKLKMMKKIILLIIPLFFGSCSVLVYNKGMAKANSYESVRLDEKLNKLTSKRDVIVELGPADEKEYEDGLEFWYYIDKTSELIPGYTSVKVTVDDDVAKGNSNHTPAMLRETEETIMFIFDGERVLRYKTENINLSEETNRLRDAQVQDTMLFTILTACWDAVWIPLGIMIATG